MSFPESIPSPNEGAPSFQLPSIIIEWVAWKVSLDLELITSTVNIEFSILNSSSWWGAPSFQLPNTNTEWIEWKVSLD